MVDIAIVDSGRWRFGGFNAAIVARPLPARMAARRRQPAPGGKRENPAAADRREKRDDA